MKKSFSTKWKASKQPRKQRKYRYNAPLHIMQGFMAAHLSPELRKKYEKRAIPLRVGDEVAVMRGQFKGKKSKVDRVDIKNSSAYLSKIETIKKDGTKTAYPFNPSNLMITTLNTDDKKRFKRMTVTQKTQQTKVTETKVKDKTKMNKPTTIREETNEPTKGAN